MFFSYSGGRGIEHRGSIFAHDAADTAERGECTSNDNATQGHAYAYGSGGSSRARVGVQKILHIFYAE